MEGGALSPPHEEIYLQGLWIEASRSIAEMADEMRDEPAATARAGRRRTDARGGRVHLLAGGPFVLRVRDVAAAHGAAASRSPGRSANGGSGV